MLSSLELIVAGLAKMMLAATLSLCIALPTAGLINGSIGLPCPGCDVAPVASPQSLIKFG